MLWLFHCNKGEKCVCQCDCSSSLEWIPHLVKDVGLRWRMLKKWGILKESLGRECLLLACSSCVLWDGFLCICLQLWLTEAFLLLPEKGSKRLAYLERIQLKVLIVIIAGKILQVNKIAAMQSRLCKSMLSNSSVYCRIRGVPSNRLYTVAGKGYAQSSGNWFMTSVSSFVHGLSSRF